MALLLGAILKPGRMLCIQREHSNGELSTAVGFARIVRISEYVCGIEFGNQQMLWLPDNYRSIEVADNRFEFKAVNGDGIIKCELLVGVYGKYTLAALKDQIYIDRILTLVSVNGKDAHRDHRDWIDRPAVVNRNSATQFSLRNDWAGTARLIVYYPKKRDLVDLHKDGFSINQFGYTYTFEFETSC